MRLVPLLEQALARLGTADHPKRALLLARLASATRGGKGIGGAPVELAREAVAIARRLGDDETLSYALGGYLLALLNPASLEECIGCATEMIALANRTRDAERLCAGHEDRFFMLWQRADMPAAHADLAQMTRLAEAMRQPPQLWVVHSCQAMLALSAGDFTRAPGLIAEAFDHGRRAQSWNAAVSNSMQLFMLARAQRRMTDVEEILTQTTRERPTYTPARFALLCIRQSRGDESGARRVLGELAANDFGAMPFDDTWLFGMTLAAETCAATREKGAAAVVHRLLSPYADLVAVAPSEVCGDSVAMALARLAALLGDDAEAEARFLQAIGTNESIGARPSLADTQRDYAAFLRKRDGAGDRERAADLLAEALVLYESLGMEAAAREAAASGP
jgi:hypothetical protein